MVPRNCLPVAVSRILEQARTKGWIKMKNFCGRHSARPAVPGILIVVIACLAPRHAAAQGVDPSSTTTTVVSTPRTADGHPDLNGVWYNGNLWKILVKTGNKTLAALPTAA